MKTILAVIVLLSISFNVTADSVKEISVAFEHGVSDIQVQAVGLVVKILADDKVGSQHQRFILKLSNSQTILIAHNIDIAPRINALAVGDAVEFFGEYEWNSKGGVVHWTHRHPAGRHPGGWLEHNGRRYE